MDDDNVFDFMAGKGKRGREIEKLASLPPEERTREKLKETAEKMDLSMTELRAAIKERTTHTKEKEAKGRAVELSEFEPWPENVVGADALSDAADAIKHRIMLPDHEADASALFVAHCHIYDAFNHTPRCMVTAPEAECGKTGFMSHVIGPMVPRAMFVEIMKAAPFFRLAEEHKPVFLIDEVDQFIKEDSDLLAAINTGFEPHGSVPRCVGDDNEVRLFRPHCPVVMAGINLPKKLPASTMSRCIVVSMDRATPDELEKLLPLRRHDSELVNIGRRLATWTKKQRREIPDAETDHGRGRTADKWTPLFQIAAVAGGDWPKRCYTAYRRMESNQSVNVSRGHELLADIREAFGSDEKIWTSTLIDRLCRDPEKPWAEFNFRARDEKRIKDKQIAKLLEPYSVGPKDIRIGGDVRRGYARKQFDRVFSRYLPPVSATSLQRSAGAGFSDSAPATHSEPVADETDEKRRNHAGCSAVADETPFPGENAEDDGYVPGADCPRCDGEGCRRCGEVTA